MVGEAGAARTSAAITARTTPRVSRPEEINPVDIETPLVKFRTTLPRLRFCSR